MNKEIKIKIYYQDPSTPYEEIVELLHDSFKERLEQNLHFGCATITLDEYRKYTENSYIFVAYDAEKIVGTGILTVKQKGGIKYGNFEDLAVKSNYKRSGIGEKMFSELSNIAFKLELQCLTSSTAIGAISSVKWHKKMGYKIFKYEAFPKTNYYSYCFIKPICGSFKVTCILLLRPFFLLATYVKCKLKYKR